MKRSEMLIKLMRFYDIRHVMLENRYIDKTQFFDELLSLIETDMLPPDRGDGPHVGVNWSSTSIDYCKMPNYKWHEEDSANLHTCHFGYECTDGAKCHE